MAVTNIIFNSTMPTGYQPTTEKLMNIRTVNKTLLAALYSTAIALPAASAIAAGGYGKNCNHGGEKMTMQGDRGSDGKHGRKYGQRLAYFKEAGKHIDGRLAFLKAELRVTSEQESLWLPVESAMRAAMQQRAGKIEQRNNTDNKALSVVDRMDQRINHMEQRLAHMKTMQGALSDLYADLTDQQQKLADELLPMMGGPRGRHH